MQWEPSTVLLGSMYPDWERLRMSEGQAEKGLENTLLVPKSGREGAPVCRSTGGGGGGVSVKQSE